MDLQTNYNMARTLGIPTPNAAEFKAYFAIFTYMGMANKAGIKRANKVGLPACLLAMLLCCIFVLSRSLHARPVARLWVDVS